MTYEALWRRLTDIYEAGEAKAVVRLVLEVRFGLSLTDILSGKVTQLSANDQTELNKIMVRLEKGEPVQYILGVADFYGRQFKVTSSVLIPRPETAELCSWIISNHQQTTEIILDIGTGSGCIAITLAVELSNSEVTGWDISDDALSIAQENAKIMEAKVSFEHQDILDTSILTSHPSPFTTIISNPPYIQPKERDGMEKNVLDYEPEAALFAPEHNPIIFYQRIGDFAWQNLNTGGSVYFELNPLTAETVGNYLREIGFLQIEYRLDQFGKQRFLKAKKI